MDNADCAIHMIEGAYLAVRVFLVIYILVWFIDAVVGTIKTMRS